MFCLETTTTLRGVDAYSYVWNTGETTESIKVGTPGTYWVVGYSKDGTCSSLPYYYNIKHGLKTCFYHLETASFIKGLKPFYKTGCFSSKTQY